jgi:antitoxin component of MazEF toxin-antitoxin module
MEKEFGVVQEINERLTLRVSARGAGLCIYLPKSLTETYGVKAGHKLKIDIKEHFVRIREEGAADASL